MFSMRLPFSNGNQVGQLTRDREWRVGTVEEVACSVVLDNARHDREKALENRGINADLWRMTSVRHPIVSL